MTHALTDTLIMIADMTIQPDKIQAFLDYALANLPICRAAAGNIAFDIWVDEARPDHVTFYEVWESAEAQQAYMAWRISRGDLVTLQSFLAGMPSFTPLRSVAA